MNTEFEYCVSIQYIYLKIFFILNLRADTVVAIGMIPLSFILAHKVTPYLD